jgi:hypothetical protein
MRKIILLFALFTIAGNLQAQNKNKSVKKTTISIVSEEDGRKTVIDTTFINADQATIDAFIQNKGIVKPTPPLPPAKFKKGQGNVPPVPPVPPAPPAPPVPDDESSFYFRFDVPDFNADFNADLKKEMEKVQESLEDVSNKLGKEMEKHLNKEELEKMQNDLEKDLKNMEIDIEKAGKHKRVIIRSKTGNVDKDEDDNTGYIYNYAAPASSWYYTSPPAAASCYAGVTDGTQFVVSGNDDAGFFNSYAYHSPCIVLKHKSKFRKVLDKIVDRILE